VLCRISRHCPPLTVPQQQTRLQTIGMA